MLPAQTKKGDVNGDGSVNISDVVAVINIIAYGADETLNTKTYNANGVSFTMVCVQGGTFKMGSDTGDSKEKPVHSVTLSSYYIGQMEVTQELWEVVMGSNPSNTKGQKLPVENVSWNDCQTFITKLNILTGQTFRLPTEAEWEYAPVVVTKAKATTTWMMLRGTKTTAKMRLMMLQLNPLISLESTTLAATWGSGVRTGIVLIAHHRRPTLRDRHRALTACAVVAVGAAGLRTAAVLIATAARLLARATASASASPSEFPSSKEDKPKQKNPLSGGRSSESEISQNLDGLLSWKLCTACRTIALEAVCLYSIVPFNFLFNSPFNFRNFSDVIEPFQGSGCVIYTTPGTLHCVE